MSKRVNRTPWIFDATGQMEGRDRSGAYPGISTAPFHTIGTFTAATTDILTMTDHGFGPANAVAGPVRVTTSSALPAGLTAGVDLFIRVIDRDTFNLYTTLFAAQDAGTAIDITGTGTGTQTMNQQNVFNIPLMVEQFKLDTGDGGDFLLTYTTDAGDRLIKLDNTPVDDTLWVPVRKRWEAVYIQTLAANGTIEVYTGDDWDS